MVNKPSTAADSFSSPALWSFELPAVASHFECHVREQLPFYDLATQAVADLVRFYLQHNGLLVDIGCATGNVSRACSAVLEERQASALSIEPSSEMVERFHGVGKVVKGRAEDAELPASDVIVSFLTLAFVPPRVRRSLLARLLGSVNPGGAVILVERVEASGNATASRLLLSAAKLRNGASAEEVVRKEVSIGGVLRPVDASMLERMGGWLFFAYGDFRGYVIEKPE
jgi:tRNA (cmo5U34)-methyltransferase